MLSVSCRSNDTSSPLKKAWRWGCFCWERERTWFLPCLLTSFFNLWCGILYYWILLLLLSIFLLLSLSQFVNLWILLNTISTFWCLQQKLTLFVLRHTFILLQNYLYDMGVDIHMSSYRTIPIQINFVGCPENKGNDIE